MRDEGERLVLVGRYGKCEGLLLMYSIETSREERQARRVSLEWAIHCDRSAILVWMMAEKSTFHTRRRLWPVSYHRLARLRRYLFQHCLASRLFVQMCKLNCSQQVMRVEQIAQSHSVLART